MAKLNELPDSALLKAYIDLRDRRAERKAAYESADAGDKEKQDKIEMEFLRRFHEQGIDSVTARGVGCAYTSTRTSTRVADRDTYFSWVLEDPDERMCFLEARANKTAVEQYKAANDDLPPGLSWNEEITVNFRRS